MKTILSFVIAVLLISRAHGQSFKKLVKDTLIWNQGDTLTMDDFQGKPKGKKTSGATWGGIYFHTKESDGTIKLLVEAIFIKSKSYLRESSLYAYKHERGHFDIFEINARKMRKRIAEKDFTKVKNIIPVIQNFYDKAVIDCSREQDQYDNDTEHGMNPAKQEVWFARVANELKELDAYSAIETDIRK